MNLQFGYFSFYSFYYCLYILLVLLGNYNLENYQTEILAKSCITGTYFPVNKISNFELYCASGLVVRVSTSEVGCRRFESWLSHTKDLQK